MSNMAEENQNPKVPVPPAELEFSKNGADIEEDDHDLFKSAMEVSQPIISST